MPSYSGLHTLITGQAYSGLTGSGLVNAVNTATVTGSVDVPVSAVEAYLRLQGLLSGAQAFATSPPSGASAASVTAAKELVGIMLSPHITTFQMSIPATNTAVTNMVTALVTQGVLTSGQASGMLALSVATTPVTLTLGFQNGITIDDLHAIGAS